MKRSSTIILIIATTGMAVLMILGGVMVPKMTLRNHETYLAVLDHQDAEFNRNVSSGDVEEKRFADEFASRGDGIRNLSSIIASIGNSLVGFGIAILIYQLLIFRSLLHFRRSQANDQANDHDEDEHSPEKNDCFIYIRCD